MIALEVMSLSRWINPNFGIGTKKNYSDMVILLTIREGALVKVQVCDCIYHFSNDVVMTFSLDGEEAQGTIIEGRCLKWRTPKR
ncbi:hypothetical protein AB6D16_023800 [Vibrio cyclitrophicus]